MVLIFHNPRCSKSREALNLIREKGIEPEIRKYLTDVLSILELKKLLKLLKCNPENIIRKKEVIYKNFYIKNPNASDNELINLMLENPIIIERPIVINNNKAILGRPPEKVLLII